MGAEDGLEAGAVEGHRRSIQLRLERPRVHAGDGGSGGIEDDGPLGALALRDHRVTQADAAQRDRGVHLHDEARAHGTQGIGALEHGGAEARALEGAGQRQASNASTGDEDVTRG